MSQGHPIAVADGGSCTLLADGDGDQQTARALIFPDATGVIHDNGVRAVVNADGDEYAVERRSFSHAGG